MRKIDPETVVIRPTAQLPGVYRTTLPGGRTVYLFNREANPHFAKVEIIKGFDWPHGTEGELITFTIPVDDVKEIAWEDLGRITQRENEAAARLKED